MIVDVKLKHIKKGKRVMFKDCPVALALKEKTGQEKVGVWRGIIRINDEVYKTPKSVLKFIDKFDYGKKVEPFRFRLGKPIRKVNEILVKIIGE